MSKFRLPLNFKEKVGRSVHRVPQPKRFTLNIGTLIPAYSRVLKRGEKAIFATPQMLLRSLPTVSPILGQFRLRVEWYFDSLANYYGWIDNDNKLTTEEVLNRRHHTIVPNQYSYEFLESIGSYNPERFSETNYREFLRRYGVGAGSLADFCGLAPGMLTTTVMSEMSNTGFAVNNDKFGQNFNADVFLAYLNIIRNYHINQQFPNVPFTYVQAGEGISDEEGIGYLSQKSLDDFFMYLRFCSNGTNFNLLDSDPDNYNKTFATKIITPSNLHNFCRDEVPQKWQQSVCDVLNYLRYVTRENSGLFCSQYMPDLMRNLLNSDADLIKSEVEVDPETGSFSIAQFRYQNHLQMIYDRIQPFGGKDSTLARTRWGVISNRDYDKPELISVQTEYIDTDVIVSDNSGSVDVDGEQLKSLPGKMSGVVNARKFAKGKQSFTANTPGVLMAIVSLVPIVDYSEGVDRHISEFMFEDEFSPQMARLGFKSVPMMRYCALPNVDVSMDTFSFEDNLSDEVGKQVAWLDDMAVVPKVHGDFARFRPLETWVLSRNYLNLKEYFVDSELDDVDSYFEYRTQKVISPYVNPADWTYPFVQQSIKDDNLQLQALFDVTLVSPVGYRFMPTLGD